jgi:hypothetical protein
VGAAWRQPSYSPRRRPPAVTVTAWSLPGSAALHRPLDPPQPVQLRRHRPGAVLQILQVAVTVERPAVNAARPATPVAGLRGAWTGVIGLRPAGASVALAEPRSGRDGDLPGPARLPAAHQTSPPLACCQAPTNPPSRRAQPSRSRMAARPPYSQGGACRTRSGCGCRPEGDGRRVVDHGSLPGHQVGVGPRPSAYTLTWGGWPAPGSATVPRSTPAQPPSARRCAACPPAPCRGVRSRVRARRPCPPGRVVPPAAPDAWRGVRWTNSRQSSETAQAAGRARRQAAAVGPG